MDRRQALQRASLAGGAALLACARDDYGSAARETWRPPEPERAPGERPALEWVRAATLAANGHNAQPWRFRVLPGAVEILPDRARRTPVVDPDDHHLWVSLGCAAENLVQAAAGDGRHLTAVFAGDRVRLELDGGRARGTLFDAIAERQSTRSVYDGTPLMPGEWRLLEHAAAEAGVQWQWFDRRADVETVLEFAVAATRVQTGDAAFRDELRRWLRFDEAEALAERDGLFTAASGHPTLPRWLGLRLFDFAYQADAEVDRLARHVRSGAGVAVFVAARAEPAGWFACGRACQRLLLQATALDIRSAFVSAPVEVPTVRPAFAAALGLSTARPDLVLRLGHGGRLPPSLRRPLEDVLARDVDA